MGPVATPSNCLAALTDVARQAVDDGSFPAGTDPAAGVTWSLVRSGSSCCGPLR